MELRKILLLVLIAAVLVAIYFLLTDGGGGDDDVESFYSFKIEFPENIKAKVFYDGDPLEDSTDYPSNYKIVNPETSSGKEIKIVFADGQEIKSNIDYEFVEGRNCLKIIKPKYLLIKNSNARSCEYSIKYDIDVELPEKFILQPNSERMIYTIQDISGNVQQLPTEDEKYFKSSDAYKFDLTDKQYQVIDNRLKKANIKRFLDIKNKQKRQDNVVISKNGDEIYNDRLNGNSEQRIELGYEWGDYKVVIDEGRLTKKVRVNEYKDYAILRYDPLEVKVFIENDRNLPGVFVKVNQEDEKAINNFQPYTITTGGDYHFEIFVPGMNYKTKEYDCEISKSSPKEIKVNYNPKRCYTAVVNNPESVNMTIKYNGETEHTSGTWKEEFEVEDMSELDIQISGDYFKTVSHTFYFTSSDGRASYTFNPDWKKGKIKVTSLLPGGKLKILDNNNNVKFEQDTIEGDITSGILNQGLTYTVKVTGLDKEHTEEVLLNTDIVEIDYPYGKPVKMVLPIPSEIINDSDIMIDDQLVNMTGNSLEISPGKHKLSIIFEMGEWQQPRLEETLNIPYTTDAYYPDLKIHTVKVTSNIDDEGGADIWIEGKNTELKTPSSIPFLSNELVKVTLYKPINANEGISRDSKWFHPSEETLISLNFSDPEAQQKLAYANSKRRLYNAETDKNGEDAIRYLTSYKDSLDKARRYDRSMPELWNAYLWFYLKMLDESSSDALIDMAKKDYYDPMEESDSQFSVWDKFLSPGLMFSIYVKNARFDLDEKTQFNLLKDYLDILDLVVERFYKIDNKEDPQLCDEVIYSALYGLFLSAKYNPDSRQRAEHKEVFEILKNDNNSLNDSKLSADVFNWKFD